MLGPDPKKRRAYTRWSRTRAEVQAERQVWREVTAAISPECLGFLNESVALTNLVRSHTWSPRGKRALGTVPCGSWERVTVLGALGAEGLLAATDSAVFHAHLE
jgi:hypothetical protein